MKKVLFPILFMTAIAVFVLLPTPSLGKKQPTIDVEAVEAVDTISSPGDTVIFFQDLTAKDAFILCCDEDLNILPYELRLDMIDYYEADSIRPTPNLAGALSSLRMMSDRRVNVEMSPVSQMQMGIFPLSKATRYGNRLIVLAYTVGNDAIVKDTRLAIYESPFDIVPTPTKYFKAPVAADFFSIPKGDKIRTADLVAMLPFTAVEYELSPDQDVITARLTSTSLATLEDVPTLQKYLRPEISYRWNGRKFVKIKEK